ncbi:fimbrillin family protein [Parabacteroides faecis]|uniref:fimbrillin family protein n=1 Tax=Parabacteroides faecis TaxID=1217282 RepID=UPI00216490D3|nr:fimbrillin family protein [Parabacteroides faecis]MCS2892705.1 fimbrillin family protein [Parabacteroides faecis]UVQ48674.1 fimbrillin family protein [Parabacteroides faecis]
MKTTHLLLSIPLALLVVSGCTSDELQEKPQTNEKGEYAVRFSGNMDMTLTKANTTDVATGVKATISAYTKDATVTSTDAIVSKGYTVGSTVGTFEGDASYVMYLPKGDYDFYAVSTNSATAAPVFTSGVSAVLANGVDYIWATSANFNVSTNTDKVVTLAFQRKAVKIIINVESGDGVELTAWKATAATDNDNATITPPDPSTTVKMNLADGVITSATTLTAAVNMTTTAVVNKKATASYIMLPLGSGQNPTVTLNVKVKIGGRDEADKQYTATLTAPASTSSAFTSGNQYTYTATLKANKIEFTGATVANWSEQTGGALTPTEP